MRHRMLALGFTALAAACGSTKAGEERDEDSATTTRVTIAELSAPARATVERLTAGGKVDQIDKETEKGRLLYDVEATVGGRHVEYAIADADGAVLGTETSVDYAELPAAVRATAEKHFGGAAGLKAMKGTEEGATYFEIVGTKDGKVAEITVDPTGKRTE